MDFQVGDLIELELDSLPTVLRTNKTTIQGLIVGIFDALTSSGEGGINLEIDITFSANQWFRYRPAKDGGSIKLIRRKHES